MKRIAIINSIDFEGNDCFYKSSQKIKLKIIYLDGNETREASNPKINLDFYSIGQIVEYDIESNSIKSIERNLTKKEIQQINIIKSIKEQELEKTKTKIYISIYEQIINPEKKTGLLTKEEELLTKEKQLAKLLFDYIVENNEKKKKVVFDELNFYSEKLEKISFIINQLNKAIPRQRKKRTLKKPQN